MTGAITFDSNDLQNYDPATNVGIITNGIEHAGIPNKDISIYKVAHANYSFIPSVNYPSKKITIKGAIKGSSDSDLDTRIDNFKAYFNGINKNLDIEYSGSTRRYIATANAQSVTRQQKALYATFAIEFICALPFGVDTSATTALSASGRTLSNYNDNYTFLGTAPFQAPIVTLTMTTIADADSQQVIWGNGSTGQVIVINRIFTSGDVIVIDCENWTVTVNGTPVAFTGAFPSFSIGAQVMQYTDSFTSRTFSVSVTYTKRYM